MNDSEKLRRFKVQTKAKIKALEDQKNILEERIENTEKALIGIWAFLRDAIPSYYAEGVSTMLADYVESNITLGSKIDSKIPIFNKRVPKPREGSHGIQDNNQT